MDERVARAIKALEGKHLWGRGRAVEMEMFQFGDRVEDVDFRGRNRVVGEYALHLTGMWRIVASGRVVAGYRDYWIPREGSSSDRFEPDLPGSSRRDQLMPRFEAHAESAHLVESAEVGELGDLRLEFADGCVLEAFADIGFVETDDEGQLEECWRLLQPALDKPHLVVWAGGEIDYPAEIEG